MTDTFDAYLSRLDKSNSNLHIKVLMDEPRNLLPYVFDSPMKEGVGC